MRDIKVIRGKVVTQHRMLVSDTEWKLRNKTKNYLHLSYVRGN